MSRKFKQISRLAVVLVPAALALGASAACAGNVGVDFNLHLGNQPQQVVVPAPVEPQPVPVVIEQDVDFVYPAQLGFYVAVGVPYDLFYAQNTYYICRDGHWFRAPGSRGPWMAMRHRDLPPGLRRHNLDRIRAYRNAEYDAYRNDRDHYRGRHFMTRKEEWKEARRAEKEERKEAKREDKEYRKEMKRAEKEERKEHKHRKHDDD
ncbi:MAG TPA: hypothetical protein VI298_09885 [Geobacteraceae bacterium]